MPSCTGFLSNIILRSDSKEKLKIKIFSVPNLKPLQNPFKVSVIYTKSFIYADTLWLSSYKQHIFWYSQKWCLWSIFFCFKTLIKYVSIYFVQKYCTLIKKIYHRINICDKIIYSLWIKFRIIWMLYYLHYSWHINYRIDS